MPQRIETLVVVKSDVKKFACADTDNVGWVLGFKNRLCENKVNRKWPFQQRHVHVYVSLRLSDHLSTPAGGSGALVVTATVDGI